MGGEKVIKAKPKRRGRHKKQVICPYCGAQALLREGSFLFENPFIKYLYVCVRYPECDTYVAAHEDTKKPMGSPANEALRKKRQLAHQHFDRLWKGSSPVFSRKQAYNWLNDKFGGHMRHMHIGSMSEGMCDLVVQESKKVKWMCNKQRADPDENY